MSNKDKICTVGGLRPNKLPGSLDLFKLFFRIEEEIRKSIALGYTTFQTGMAMGVDIWAAEIVLKLKTEFPETGLICCLSYEKQADKWTEEWREKYFNILSAAYGILCPQANYSTGCMQRRTHTMIDSSSHLIAVHDGTSHGETAQAIRYAQAQGLDVIIIRSSDCPRE